MKTDPQRRYRAGVWAERAAGIVFMLKGYQILAHRFKSPVGEVDLIARRGGRLVFVEVKFRQSLDEAVFSLTSHQKRRIVRAAGFWMAQQRDDRAYEISFDVMLFAPWRLPRHISHAFEDDFG